jgi:hypothetical protein
MPGPFPGMDPYLEVHWLDVHASLVVYARDQLSEKLPAGLAARVEEYVAVESDDARPRRRSPDVQIREEPSGVHPTAGGTVAMLDADEDVLLLPVDSDPPTQRELRIIDVTDRNRLVTAIEFLSVTNKTTGRRDYCEKQRQLLEVGVNLVEIDLIRSGSWVLVPSENDIPPRWHSPYKISVFRTVPVEANWYYAASFKRRLPSIQIPLRPEDHLVRLELQPLIDRAYDMAGYAALDYTREPIPPLSPTDAQWVDEWLKQQGKR